MNYCPTNQVKSMTKVGNKIVITMDDCTFYEVPINRLDESIYERVYPYLTEVTQEEDALVFIQKLNDTLKEVRIPYPKATDKTLGLVKLADSDDLVNLSGAVAVTPAGVHELINNYITGSSTGTISYVRLTNTSGKVVLGSIVGA